MSWNTTGTRIDSTDRMDCRDRSVAAVAVVEEVEEAAEDVVPEDVGTGRVVGEIHRLGEVVQHRPGLRVAIQAAKGVVEVWSPPGVAEAVQPRL